MALKEVSCQILSFFFTSLKENKIPLAVMTQGIPYDINYLLNKKNSIEWDVLCKITSNIRAIKDDDEYFVELGIRLVEKKVIPLISMLAGFFVNVQDIYRMINNPKKGMGHAHTKCIVPDLREIEEGHFEIKLEVSPGYQNCREYFLLTKGFFTAVPLLLKSKPAKVIMQETEFGAIYNVSYPVGTNPFSWLRSLFSFPSSKKAALQELNDSYELLYDRFHQLEESKEQIQLQKQLLETAYQFTQLIRGELELDDTIQIISQSILDLDGFEAVEIKVDATMEGEQVIRHLKYGNPISGASGISCRLQAHGQTLGNITIWLNPNSNNLFVQKLLNYILPSISMEILNSLSFELLTNYRNELENRVTERTKQLHKINRALTDSINKLKELKLARDKFFAAISHEFRTPLTLIMEPSKNILSNSSDLNIKKKAEIINRNANRMLTLVNQLLDLSRLDYGKFELKPSAGDIVDFVRKLFFSFESLAESKDILLKFLCDEDRIELYFDGEVMLKIITNLLSNAFKFTDPGGIISIQLVQIDNSMIEIRLRDTGIGIDEFHISKLFDRFYQVDQSNTRKYEGSGIGLALTKELVELHHGKISVHSQPQISGDVNSGWTEFSLRFPLGTSHFKSDEIIEKESQKKYFSESNYLNPDLLFPSEITEAEVSIEEKTIVLVVEDNSDLREIIKENLQDIYFVMEAQNGAHGFKIAEENVPDLIISDIMMPEMDGYELTKKLKTNEKTNHIPIILLTAKAATEDKLVGLETGADDYLIKPFDERELTIRVKNLIKIRKQMRDKYLAQSLVLPGSIVVPTSQKEFIEKLTSIIAKNISNEKFSVEVLCSDIGMSRTQLHRKIKSVTNQSTTEFIRNYRLQLAAEFLKQDGGNIGEISNKVGFSSQAYFTKLFQDLYGQTPLDYRKQYKKES